MTLTLMTPKQNRDIDTSAYAHLGRHHWKAFMSATGKFDPGKANYKPRLEMLAPGGTVKIFYDHKQNTITEVVYDEEFVFEYYYQRLIVTMGWDNSGELDEEVLNLFFTKLTEYARGKVKSTHDEKIEKQARSMAEAFPHRSFEQWKEFLLAEVVPEVKEEPKHDNRVKLDQRDIDRISRYSDDDEQKEESQPTDVSDDSTNDDIAADTGEELLKDEIKRRRGRPRKQS